MHTRSGLFRQLLAVLICQSTVLIASDAYRISDDFDLAFSASSQSVDFIDLYDGSHVAHGAFDQIDGVLSGSVGLLKADGSLEPFFSDYPLLGYELAAAVKNADGGYSLLAYPSSSSDYSESAPNYFRYSATGQLQLAASNPSILALLPDGKFIYDRVEQATEGNQTVYYKRLLRGSLNAQGQIVQDAGFSGPRLLGTLHAIHRLRSGRLLVVGDLTRVNTTNVTGQLVKLEGNGSLATGFDLNGMPSAGASLYQAKIFEMPSGEIFLLTLGNTSPSVVRLLSNGQHDPNFNLPSYINFHQGTRILPAGNGRYYLADVVIAAGERNKLLARVNSNGSIDTTFDFDSTGRFDGSSTLSSTARLPSGDLIMHGPFSVDADSSYGFARIGADGTATRLSTRAAYSARAQARWTPHGELLFSSSAEVSLPGSENSPSNQGIARADGSIRILFDQDDPLPSWALRDGRFLSGDHRVFSETGRYLHHLPVEAGTSIIAALDEGNWLATRAAQRVRQPDLLVRLLPDGIDDPRFQPVPLPIRLETILAYSNGFIYVAEDDDGSVNVRRLSLGGEYDASFVISHLSNRPTQLLATSQGLYLFGVGSVSGVEKPFGARFGLTDGKLDTGYRPESTIMRLPQAGNSHGFVYASDGSSLQFGVARSDGADSPSESVWSISPNGQVARLGEGETWKEAYLDVSMDGDVFVSGTARLPIGPLTISAVYSRRPFTFSASKYEETVPTAQTARFEVTLLDATGASLQWRKNGVPIPGATNSTLELSPLAPSDTGEYTLSVTLSGKSYSIGIFSLLPPSRPVVLYHPKDAELAFGATSALVLRGAAKAIPAPQYQWFHNGHPVPGADGPSLALEGGSLSKLGTYRLRVSNSIGVTWSEPAVVRGGAWWPSVGNVLQFSRQVSSGIQDIAPLPHGAIALRIRDDRTHQPSIDKVNTNGERLSGWEATVDLKGYSHWELSEGVGRLFAFDAQYKVDDSDQLRKYFRFVRLRNELEADDAFGAHVIDGETADAIRFKEWPDGSVWVQTSTRAISISVNGAVSQLPALNYDGGNRLIDAVSCQLDDGRFIIGDRHSTGMFYLSDLATPPLNRKALIADPLGDDPLIAVWPSGVALFRNHETNTLVARHVDDEPTMQNRWALALGSEELAGPPFGWPTIVSSIDSTRKFIVTRASNKPAQAKLSWIDSDGSSNFESGYLFESLDRIEKVIHLGGTRFALFGWEQPKLDGPQFAGYQLVDLAHEPTKPTVPFATKPVWDFTASPPSPDGSVFILHSGDYLNGTAVTPIVKLDPNGSLIRSFAIGDALDDLTAGPVSLEPLRNGGVAVAYSSIGDYKVAVFDATGNLVKRIGSFSTAASLRALASGGFLLAGYTHEDAGQIWRYSDASELDPTFANGVKASPGVISYMTTDSKGRIYGLQNYSGQLSVIRLSSAGELDNDYQLSRGLGMVSSLHIDAAGRLLVPSDRLARFLENGQEDPSFTFHTNVNGLGGPSIPLPDGRIYFAGYLLNPDGSIHTQMTDLHGHGPLAISGNAGLRIREDPEAEALRWETFSLEPLPQILSLPRSIKTHLGSRAVFAVEMDSAKPFRYQWYLNGAALEGANASRLAISSVSESDAGTYQARVWWDGGGFLSPPASLTVLKDALAQTTPRDLQLLPLRDWVELSWTQPTGQTTTLWESTDLLLWQIAPADLYFEGQSVRCLHRLDSSRRGAFYKLESVAD